MKIIILALVLLCGSVALAEEQFPKTFDTEFNVDYYSKYIWRGQEVADDVMQPSITISSDTLSLNVWANYKGVNDSSENEVDEYDFDLSYRNNFFDYSGVKYEVGVVNYVYPSTKYSSNTDIYAGLTFDTWLSPNITIYKGVDVSYGTYAKFAISRKLENPLMSFEHPFDINFDAGIGWADRKFNDTFLGVNESGWNDLSLKLSTDIPVGTWTITPSINYVVMLEEYDVENDEFVFFGMSLRRSF